MKNFLKVSVLVAMQVCAFGFSEEEILFPCELEHKTPKVVRLLERVDQVRNRSIGWCSKAKSEAIVALILNTKPQTCVEIGVFGGSSFFAIPLALEYLNTGHAYAIDCWNNADCIKYMPDHDPNKPYWGQMDFTGIAYEFKRIMNAEQLGKWCTLYHEESVAAADRFQNQSIDFLHWDGNHSYYGAKRELQAYLPKVKSGGYILVSDVMWGVHNKNPIQEASDFLFKHCDLIDTFDICNVFLFRKQ